ncbi:hypothetical protein EBI01_18610 [Marinomonas rhizomae]|uniref:Uncharacterized protein n=1 Tax=Marinomonas rhizomae TaxID=491948 RepID=A0A366IUH9_9GAMM|nr:hypothetical protein [Marinomonas rhizomae]RBP78227.1 hypothetical protein DFP80_12115 [Marinomonas rhizomae]RNF69823.1 hypothetical protein EBI01_18610 [Marinomonas rhizomae]
MKDVNNLPHLSTILCSVLLLLSVSACSREVKNTHESSLVSSDNIKAVVYIESPKVGTLLQLRGIAGKGLLIVKNDDKQNEQVTCSSSPIRFAAGDFGGDSIGIQSMEPIRLLIYSDKVVKKLNAGDEIVTEDYDITDRGDARLGDIKIESGLTLSYGFVLNPGEWSWSSVFGLDREKVDCGAMLTNRRHEKDRTLI